MSRFAIFSSCLLLALMATAGAAEAADMPRSGFFDSYSKLQPVDASRNSYRYTSDQLKEILSTTQAIVIPQPEIFLADDSKYKGISPDELKMLADTFQSLIIEALADRYQIAQRPGPNTIVLRTALTNVHLKRKGRIPVLGYMPTAFVITSIKRIGDELTDKIMLTEVTWEAEMLDGGNADVLLQLLVPMGNYSTKKEFTSWDDLVIAISVGGMRLRCRLDNAADGSAKNCLDITEADLPAQ